MLLFLVALYLVYDLRDDLRGAAKWAEAKDQLKKARISIDPKDYLSGPIPDAQNFGALPIFQFSTDPKSGAPKLAALHQALDPLSESIYYPSFEKYVPGKLLDVGDWTKNEADHMTEVRTQLEEFCRHAKPAIVVPPSASSSDILGLICPAFADLRRENQQRPLCRFDLGFGGPVFRIADKIVEFADGQIELAKAMSYEETLAVREGYPQLALDDLKIGWKIGSGLKEEPAQITALVHLGVAAIHRGVIQDGLGRHVWNDGQLQELDEGLGETDFLAEAQFTQRGDFAVYDIPLNERYKGDPTFWIAESRRLAKEGNVPVKESFYFWTSIWLWLTPGGSYEEGLADYAPYLLPGDRQLIDLPSRRVFAERAANFPPEKADDSARPIPANSWRRAVQYFAFAQVQTDLARIACRLERYRLANGSHPASLDALAPQYGALPHDIMNGQPYHYKPNSDGSYLLYSVGWNQKDDGGDRGTHNQSDAEKPDWLWPNSADGKS